MLLTVFPPMPSTPQPERLRQLPVRRFRRGEPLTSWLWIPSGRFLYVANICDDNISAYAIDASTGALEPVPGSPFAAGSGPIAVVVDPSGRFAYANNMWSSDVTAYSIDASTGALSQISGSPFQAGLYPQRLTVDPAGRFVYVPNAGSDGISVFSIDGGTWSTHVGLRLSICHSLWAPSRKGGPNWSFCLCRQWAGECRVGLRKRRNHGSADTAFRLAVSCGRKLCPSMSPWTRLADSHTSQASTQAMSRRMPSTPSLENLRQSSGSPFLAGSSKQPQSRLLRPVNRRATNRPVAVAGPNQIVRPGSGVQLDGAGSSDDNTASSALSYLWTLASTPSGKSHDADRRGHNEPELHARRRGEATLVRLVVTDGRRPDQRVVRRRASCRTCLPAASRRTGPVGPDSEWR